MQIQIEQTDIILELDGVPVRLWKGTTASGAECDVFVHRIGVIDGQSKEFSDCLVEQADPKTTWQFSSKFLN